MDLGGRSQHSVQIEKGGLAHRQQGLIRIHLTMLCTAGSRRHCLACQMLDCLALPRAEAEDRGPSGVHWGSRILTQQLTTGGSGPAQ